LDTLAMYVHNFIPAYKEILYRKTVRPQEIPPFLFHTFLVKQKQKNVVGKMEGNCQVTFSFQKTFYLLPQLSNRLQNGVVNWRWVIEISISNKYIPDYTLYS
jgi:hypothetical protein